MWFHFSRPLSLSPVSTPSPIPQVICNCVISPPSHRLGRRPDLDRTPSDPEYTVVRGDYGSGGRSEYNERIKYGSGGGSHSSQYSPAASYHYHQTLFSPRPTLIATVTAVCNNPDD